MISSVYKKGMLLLAVFCLNIFAIQATPPYEAETNSHIDLSFQWDAGAGISGTVRGLFGILLPKGWTVSDKNNFTVHSGTSIDGQFAYCQFYSDFLEKESPAPNGYYWCGGRALDKIELSRATGFDFSIRVHTDKQTGDFNLKYSFGTDPFSRINNRMISEPFKVTVTKGNEFPVEKINSWELIPGNWSSSYYSDKDFDGYFLRYYGWNGGDIGISTLLPDGRSIWTWGDYHSGVVNSERNRLRELDQFPRNALMVQDGENFSAFRLLTEDRLGYISVPLEYKDDNGNVINGGDQWYWPMGGSVYYRDGVPELQILLEHTINAGGGTWGMEAISCDVAIYSLPDLQLQRVVKDRYVGKIAFANIAFKDDDGVVYIYGERNHGLCGSATFAARCIDGDLSGTWEYYNGKDKIWSTDHSWENNEATMFDYKIVDNPIFVFKDCGKYYAFEQTACFGRTTNIFEAESPIGPFSNRKKVGELPEEISTGNFLCYIPALHQQFSQNGELLYCVSKNNKDIGWYNYPGSGDIYLPHFFRVKNWRDKLSIADNDLTSNNEGALSAQQEHNSNFLIDKDEKTIYSASIQEGGTWIQYQSPESLFLRRYSITSAENSPEKDPLHWQILGSQDGINWTVIDERFYSKFDERSQTNCYTVPKDYSFRYFRMNILAANGDSDLQIAEWQLFGQYGEAANVSIPKVAAKNSNAISFYPNPVQNYLNIEGTNEIIEKVVVSDVKGSIQHISTPYSTKHQISMNDWSKGVYFAHVFTKQGSFSQKILKQ